MSVFFDSVIYWSVFGVFAGIGLLCLAHWGWERLQTTDPDEIATAADSFRVSAHEQKGALTMNSILNILAASLIPLSIAGLITHIWVCIAANSASYVALLLVGLAFFPVGIVHGWGVWFGVW